MESADRNPSARPALHPSFVDNLVRTFNDPDEHGVHLLFNEWWAHAPASVVERYVKLLRETPGSDAFLEARHLAEPVTLEALEAMPPRSVGHGYFRFLTENGLEKNLATNYKKLHDFMGAAGHLDRMPDEFKYAIIRGFQIHDLLHVITGFTSSGLDELSLQAFCLAQLQFPYFGMWMATTTSRMTFLDPGAIVPVMDAISRGWQIGRTTGNLQFERWENRLEEALVVVRPEFGLPAEGVSAAEARQVP